MQKEMGLTGLMGAGAVIPVTQFEFDFWIVLLQIYQI